MIIILLLAYIVLKNPVSNYFKRQAIANRTSILFVPEVWVVCYDSIKSDTDFTQKCKEVMTSFTEKRKRWDNLIINNTDISCKDFGNGWEAFEFFNYVGKGEYAMSIDVGRSSPKAYFSGNKCSVDPYGLDTDGDCTPCEQINNN